MAKTTQWEQDTVIETPLLIDAEKAMRCMAFVVALRRRVTIYYYCCHCCFVCLSSRLCVWPLHLLVLYCTYVLSVSHYARRVDRERLLATSTWTTFACANRRRPLPGSTSKTIVRASVRNPRAQTVPFQCISESNLINLKQTTTSQPINPTDTILTRHMNDLTFSID
jgi:hypothetical protein